MNFYGQIKKWKKAGISFNILNYLLRNLFINYYDKCHHQK